jgi:ABC-type nitrate/sulfonate/bicarbonate transport system substrate-binding protein
MKCSCKVKVLTGIIVLAATVGTFYGVKTVTAAPKKELFEMRTWSRKDCSLAPWLVTDKLGYFAEEGIKLVYTGETQGPLQIPSIIRGNNDIGAGHANQYGAAIAGGANLVAVVRGGIEPAPTYDPKFRHMWWFVNSSKTPDIKTFADLKKIPGKIKISTLNKGTCTELLNQKLGEKYGIPKDKFEWVTMPDIQAIQALKQGLIHVSSVHPPFYKGMQDSGALKIADSSDAGLGSSAGLSFYWFRKDYVQQHPKEVAGFVRAIKKGQRWANANPEKAAKWVEEVIGVPVTGNHYYAEDSTIVEKDLDPWIHFLEENKIAPKGKITAASIVTHQFEQIGNDDKAFQEKLKKKSIKKKS